jgi:hypothetical protein
MKTELYNLVVKLDRALDNIEAVQIDILNLKDEIKAMLDKQIEEAK